MPIFLQWTLFPLLASRNRLMKSHNALLVAVVIAALSLGAWSLTKPASSNPGTNPASSTLATTDRAASDDSSAPVESASTQSERHSAISFRRDGLWFSTADEGTQLHVHGY